MEKCTRHSEYTKIPEAKYCGNCGEELKRENGLLRRAKDISGVFLEFNLSEFGKGCATLGGLATMIGSTIPLSTGHETFGVYMLFGGVGCLLANTVIDEVYFYHNPPDRFHYPE